MSVLFTTSETKSVSKDIPDTSTSGAASRKLVEASGEKYVDAMSTKSGVTITSDKDLATARVKLANKYAEEKVTSATTAISRNINVTSSKIKSAASSATTPVTDSYDTIIEQTNEVASLKKSIIGAVQGICGSMDGTTSALIAELNLLLNQLSFNAFFKDLLLDWRLSGLLEAFSKCIFWNKEHSKQLAGSVALLTKEGNIDTYRDILKTNINLPKRVDAECKQNAINSPVPGKSPEEHAADISTVFGTTGDNPTEHYKTTSTGITTEQIDISSDTFDLNKTDINTAILFENTNTVHMAHSVKQQYN